MSQAPAPPLRKKRLLIAEAISVQHDVQKTFFQRRGFHVMVATDDLSVLAMASAESPDAIVLAAEADTVPCEELCRKLKKDPATRAVPLVVWGAGGDAATRQNLDTAGADAFVARSEGREALLLSVAAQLRIPARKNSRITALFSILSEGGERETLGKAYEIGEGGMGLEVGRPYGQGETLRIRFRLPGDKADIRATGIVRWVAPRGQEVFGMGIEFSEMPDECQKRLNGYMDRSLSMAGA